MLLPARPSLLFRGGMLCKSEYHNFCFGASVGGGEFRRLRAASSFAMAARRRKVHSTPFPPGGENCVRSLAPPLPGEPASLGFAGSNEGLGKTPPGTAPDEHFVLIVAFPRTPIYGGYPWKQAESFRRAKSE